MSKQNDFAMDYDALSELAKQVGDMQTEFDQMLKSFDELVVSVDGQWQGKAQVEFAVAYSKLRPKLDAISTVLQNYATEINNAATNEQALESINERLETIYNVSYAIRYGYRAAHRYLLSFIDDFLK
jgi:WXG100 family type VII secretion target